MDGRADQYALAATAFPVAPTVTAVTPTRSQPATPVLGAPCGDYGRLAEAAGSEQLACDGAHWVRSASPTDVRAIGAPCAGFRKYAMARWPDGYLITCFSADGGPDPIAGPGSSWQPYRS